MAKISYTQDVSSHLLFTSGGLHPACECLLVGRYARHAKSQKTPWTTARVPGGLLSVYG